MWKKSKRILLCILALMLLLSMAKSEQLFVQADMESTEKVQTKDVKNRKKTRMKKDRKKVQIRKKKHQRKLHKKQKRQ